MIAPLYQSVTVLSNVLIGDHVRHVTVKLAEKIPYEPGQFFMLRMRNPVGDYIERSYSAAGFSTTDEVEFVVRIEPHGQMSSLIDVMEPGAQFELKGPFGRFGFPSLPTSCEKLVLIAAGVGIAPLRSMIQKSVALGSSYKIQLFYGFRNPKDFLFREEFEGYIRNNQLEIITSVSDKSLESWNLKGYITNHLSPSIGDPHPGTHSFICGPPPMVKSCREKLFSLGFDRGQVHVEAW